MKYIEKHPMIMILVGIFGISMSAILVRFSTAPSAVTAAWRLGWTVLLQTPVVFGRTQFRQEIKIVDKKTVLMSVVSGIFLAFHFFLWFESLRNTTIASSSIIVSTEVIWVSLGFLLFLKGKISGKAVAAIAVAFCGSVVIALSDSGSGGTHLYGDLLALLAAITVAVYMLVGRIVRSSVSTTVYTYLVYTACFVMLFAMCLLQGQNVMAYGWRMVIIGFLLALFPTILGHSVFSWCLKYFSPSFVSASKLCEPAVSISLAAILFAEIPTVLQIVGGILVLGSVFYYARLEDK